MFELTEYVDPAKVLAALAAPCLDNDHADRLVKYYRVVKDKGEVTVRYVQKEEGFGRYFPENGSPLYAVYQWRSLRATLYSDDHTDIDAKSCHPTLLAYLAEQHSLPCPHLKAYISDRQQYWDALDIPDSAVQRYNVATGSNYSKNDIAKTIFTMVMYAPPESNSLPAKIKSEFHLTKVPFRKNRGFELVRELKSLSSRLATLPEYADVHGNHSGQKVSRIVNNMESEVVLELMDKMQKAGVPPTSYMYDGFQVRSQNYQQIDRVLADFNATNKYGLTFIRKAYSCPMSEVPHRKRTDEEIKSCLEQATCRSIEEEDEWLGGSDEEEEEDTAFCPIKFSKIVDQYPVVDKKGVVLFMASSDQEMQRKKVYFERFHCLVSKQKMMAELLEDGWNIFAMYKLREYFTNLTYIDSKGRGKPFITWWLEQPDRRTKQKMVFIPYSLRKPDVPDGVLNLFTGFKHEYDPDFQVDMGKVEPILTHIKEVWVNTNALDGDDEGLLEYVVNWFAHILQKPQTKTGVNLTVKSVRQGVGKNSVTDFFGRHVLGDRYFRQVADIDRLLSKFNSASEYSLLTVMDEISSKGSAFKMAGSLKEFTTRTYFEVERKGLESYQAIDYNNSIKFSNDDWIVRKEVGDRRELCLECSSKYVTDDSYWQHLYRHVLNDEHGLHFFHYLMQRDLSNWNVKAVPSTDWGARLVNGNVDTYLDTLCHIARDVKEEKFYSTQEIMDIFNGLAPEHKHRGYTSVIGFGKSWARYTNWEPVQKRVGGQLERGYFVNPEMLLETGRSINRDPNWTIY